MHRSGRAQGCARVRTDAALILIWREPFCIKHKSTLELLRSSAMAFK